MWEWIKKYYSIWFIPENGVFIVYLGIYFFFVFPHLNIIDFCNKNEGFFSALVGFSAIVISVLTYHNQKKEQTKNAQENAKLQRELTEQNNKFQAELQLKQIRLDKYNLLIINWRNLYNLRSFIVILTGVLDVDIRENENNIKTEHITLETLYYFYKNFTNENENEIILYNILSYLNELNFLFGKDKFENLDDVLDLVYRYYVLIKSCHYYSKKNFYTFRRK